MALRPLIAIKALKMNVATGWVAGTRPTITPIGTGDLGHLPLLVEADFAVAYLPGQALVDPGARDRVLERLVANVPHSGFGDRGDCQGMGLIGDHRRQGAQERIDPRLAPIFNLALRGESLVHQRLDDRMSGGRRRLGSGYRADLVYFGNCSGSPSKSSREKELNGAIPYCEARIASVETASHDVTVMSR